MITERQRILLTGGRAPAALELARLLHESGHTVYVAESVEHHLCRRSNAIAGSFRLPPPRQQPEAYLQEMEQLLIRLDIQLLLPTCEEIFYVAHGHERLGSICRVLSPPLEQLRQLHHKGEFIRQVRQAGLAAPETELITDAASWQHVQRSIRQWVQQDEQKTTAVMDSGCDTVNDERGPHPAEMYSGPVVLKPAYSRFASRVLLPSFFRQLYRNTGQGKGRVQPQFAAVPDALSVHEPWVAQRYLDGESICTYSIVHKGNVVAHAAYRSHYRSGRAGASVHFEALDGTETLNWVRQFAKSQQDQYGAVFSGQISFDLIVSDMDQRLYPIECNPRTTSGVHLFRLEDGLEMALLDPDQLIAAGRIIQPQPGSRAMLTLPMLVSGWRQAWSWDDWKIWFAAMKGTRDAVYHPADWGPWLEQFYLLRDAWRLSRRERISITEALTHDIEWNGQPLPAVAADHTEISEQ